MYEGAMLPGSGADRPLCRLMSFMLSHPEAQPPARPCRQKPARCVVLKLMLRVLTTLVPPLVLIFLVLGTIFLGIATPTEGGAMGAAGALILALGRKRIDLQAAQAGDGNHRQAILLRDLHSGRLDGLRSDLPRRQWRPVG
jgi:TRAP-type mannitol/chloroaromatic compound transport system permease large subunit